MRALTFLYIGLSFVFTGGSFAADWQITTQEANGYCKAVGGRLLTEAE